MGLRPAAITFRRIRTSSGSSSKPTSKACTTIARTASLRSRSKPSTAESRTEALRRRLTISRNRECHLFPIPLFPPSRRCSTSWSRKSRRRNRPTPGNASMNLSEANILIAEFEKRYPSVKVKLNRTGSEKLLSKVLAEARAKKLFADVIQTVEFSMHIFNRSGVLARHTAQADALYPKNFKEAGYWTTVYYNPYRSEEHT